MTDKQIRDRIVGTLTTRKKTVIDEMRVCPFDGQLVVCDSDCDNCDWAEDEDDGTD